METTKIQYDGQDYLQLKLEAVRQKDQSFYLGIVKASDFLGIYTVRPAQYDLEKHTSLAKSFPDEAGYYTHLITDDRDNIQHKDFQRDPNSERIMSISKFLNEEEYAFFPNTIIANCELINDWQEFEIDETSSAESFFQARTKPDFISFLKKENDEFILFIPCRANAVLVIDGQHRLEGLKRANIEIQDNYDLIISFLIGFDRSIIAKQFYTINYEQKPVNKSLLYQLTGEFTRELSELSFMHNVVKLLNEIEESPFYGRVKMLGKTPKNLDPEAKKRLSISQSFLIDSTIRFVSAKARGTTYPPIFLKYFQDSSEHIYIVRAISRYFNAVKELKPDWTDPANSVLSKGMGVTALLKVLNLLFPVIFEKEMNGDWKKIDELKIDSYKHFLSGLQRVDFSTDGPYGKTGSAGSIVKIKNDVIQNLDYIGRPNDAEFEQSLKDTYLKRFNKILDAIVLKKPS